MPEPSSELGLLSNLNNMSSWDEGSSSSYPKEIKEAFLSPGSTIEDVLMRGQIPIAYVPPQTREINRSIEAMKRKAARDNDFQPPKDMERWMAMPARLRSSLLFQALTPSVGGRARNDTVSAFIGQSARTNESMGSKLKRWIGKGSKQQKGMSE